jgi:hypothetical protein
MTETEQALMNRVQAAEYLLTRILSDLLAQAPDPAAAGNDFLLSIRNDLYFAVTVRTKNPAKSDHLADEVSQLAEQIAVDAVKRVKIEAARNRRPRSRNPEKTG